MALSLLFGGYVSDIHINDLDPSIWSFWKAVLDHTDDFVRLVETVPIDLKQWHIQKEIQSTGDKSDPLTLGFAAFFLNRTNRSGIIKGAGVIGGLAQTGDYKIDCRFNREELARRIRRIKKYRSRIHLTRKDAVKFMRQSSNLPPETLFCIDPPYFKKGSKLYTSFYGPNDHKVVSEAVLSLQFPWLVTYDNAKEIRHLYSSRRQFVFDINYSVQTKRVGTELLVVSKGLRLPAEVREHKLTNASSAAI